jgi:hypothetical protein
MATLWFRNTIVFFVFLDSSSRCCLLCSILLEPHNNDAVLEHKCIFLVFRFIFPLLFAVFNLAGAA